MGNGIQTYIFNRAIKGRKTLLLSQHLNEKIVGKKSAIQVGSSFLRNVTCFSNLGESICIPACIFTGQSLLSEATAHADYKVPEKQKNAQQIKLVFG